MKQLILTSLMLLLLLMMMMMMMMIMMMTTMYFFKMIHGTLSSGLTETQCSSLCQAANIGSEGEKTFDTG